MWGAPAGPQAARRRYIKRLPVPCLPQSHMGGSMWDRSSVCVAAIVLILSHPCVPLVNSRRCCKTPKPTPGSYLALYLPDESPLPENFASLFPCGVFVLASPWPAGMPLPPTGLMEDSQRSVREVQLHSKEYRGGGGEGRRRRKGLRKSADCVGMVTQMMSRSQF